MSVEVILSVDDAANVVATCDGALLGAPVALASLPALTATSNPYFYDPRGLGARLYAALGGDALRARLDATQPRVLYLDADERAAALPWEYAYMGDDFLALHYGMLRRVTSRRPLAPAAGGPLHFLALAADPLVDATGSAVTQRLAVEQEFAHIQSVLRESDAAVRARRVPPTTRRLRQALMRGPAVLHLSCHGSVETMVVGGGTQPMAVLMLEDPNGAPDLLRGDRLLDMAPAGVLRLVVFSACQSALGANGDAAAADGETPVAADYANLARALVAAGTPAAVGMQGNFPDRLSDEFAGELYRFLLAGYGLAEALRQARMALDRAPGALGLPVGYVAHGVEARFALAPGRPEVTSLAAGDGYTSLPAELMPPAFFVGRGAELHRLARMVRLGQEDAGLEQAGADVVTVVGSGGIGKTTLAGAFARRFGWRFPGGVAGATLANLPTLEPRTFLAELARRVGGAPLETLAQLDATALADLIGEQARRRQTLLLVDNYESVLQALEAADADGDGNGAAVSAEVRANAAAIHRALANWAKQGVLLLLTSRQHPAGVAGEVVYPDPRAQLDGVSTAAGAELFFHHSTRARYDRRGHAALAQQVAAVTEGHPLAIALLAGEFDVSDAVTPAHFLEHWDAELAAARRQGMAGHHVRFEVAFRRSFDALAPAAQTRLVQLSRFPAPFFAAMAARLWEPAAADDEAEAAAAQQLGDFVRRSLLKVDNWLDGGDVPATWRFDPATQRTVAAQDVAADGDGAGMAAAVNWLVNRLYGETGSSTALAQLAQQWLPALMGNAGAQSEAGLPWYAWQLAVIAGQFGNYGEAEALLAMAELTARELHDDAALARVVHESAGRMVTRGDLDRALGLYEESLAIQEKLGDIRGKSATLHELANVYVTRGDLDRALGLYEESLAIQEKLGDISGKSATLHELAYVYVTRGDLDRALGLYEEILATDEKLGDIRGKSATLAMMANVYVTRGDLDRALGLYEESLAIQEKLGDISGMTTTLSMMANLRMNQSEWDGAEGLLTEALRLANKLKYPSEIAFNTVKLGQVAQGRGDVSTARVRYQEGLAIFQRLGMPEANQVRSMLAALDGGGAARPATPGQALLALVRAAGETRRGRVPVPAVQQALAQAAGDANFPPAMQAFFGALGAALAAQGADAPAAFAALSAAVAPLLAEVEEAAHVPLWEGLARFAGGSDQPALAVAWQAQAVDRLRALPAGRQSQEQLSILLFNHAGYLAAAGDLDAAVDALAEVVALDEAWGLPDLESDRQALHRMRRRAGEADDDDGDAQALLAALAQQLEQLDPQQRAQLEEAMQRFAQFSPDEQAAMLANQARSAVDDEADGVVETVLQAHAAGTVAALLPRLDEAAAIYAEGEAPGSPYAELAAFVAAVAALLRGETAPPVPAAHVGRFAAVRGRVGR